MGTDLATVKTQAKRVGDKVIISGTKRWCTGTTLTDNIFVLARDADLDKKYTNLNIVIVPVDTPGISITPLDVIGLRGVGTTDLTMWRFQQSIFWAGLISGTPSGASWRARP